MRGREEVWRIVVSMDGWLFGSSVWRGIDDTILVLSLLLLSLVVPTRDEVVRIIIIVFYFDGFC